LVALFAGCNLMTGLSSIELTGDAGGNGSGATGSGAGAGTGAGTTTTSAAGGAGAGTTTAGGGSGASGLAGGAGAGAGTPPPQCSPACGTHMHCELGTLTCVCDPGFTQQGSACNPVAPGDPTTHTQPEVCQKWQQGHVVTTPDALVSNGQACDAGSLAQGALNDTLTRINMFRWMAGLGPTGDDPSMDASAQKCANLEAWYTWPSGGSPHQPAAGDSQCWTQEGASTAGASNIAWGSGHPAQAMDQFVEDGGNSTTMGHRRWVLNPPLDPVGIGYWTGGGQYGDGMCLMVFSGGGSGPFPAWTAFPPPGYVPIEVAGWTWTFHGDDGNIANAQISMLRVDDNAPLAVNVQSLYQGYGQTATSWTPSGWSAQAGMTYRVTVAGLSSGNVVYDVKPVTCN